VPLLLKRIRAWRPDADVIRYDYGAWRALIGGCPPGKLASNEYAVLPVNHRVLRSDEGSAAVPVHARR
jgi:hypothetical protein